MQRSSVARSVGLTFTAKLGVLMMTAATQSCLAWVLGPADRGSFAACQIYSLVLTLFFVPGLNAASLYFVSSKKTSLSNGITNVLVFGFFASAAAMSAGLLAIQLDIGFFKKASLESYRLSLITIPLHLFFQTFSSLFTAIERYKLYSAVIVIDAIYLLCFTIVFVLFLRLGVNGAILANIVKESLSLLTMLVIYYTKFGVRLGRPIAKDLWIYFTFGIRYHIGKVSNYLNIQMGTMFMVFFATREEIGLFAIATQIISKMLIISDSLQTVLIPKMASDRKDKGVLIAQCTRITMIVSAITLAGLCLFAWPVVALLFSPRFLGAVPIIRVLAIGIFIRSSAKVFEPYLLGTGHPGSISVSSVVVLVVNFLLVWLLLPLFGVLGASLGTTLAYACGGFALFCYFRKYSQLGVSVLRINRRDFSLLRGFLRDMVKV